MTRDEQSRRAFALDSRTVWVEQKMVKGMVIGIDNTPLGPGEYQPGMRPEMARHISTPSLGVRGMGADHFHPFRSGGSRGRSSPTGQIRGKIATPYSIDAAWSTGDASVWAEENRSLARESGTIFHDHDKRQHYRLDGPDTPGSYIGPSSIYEPVRFDGGKGMIRPVTFSKAPWDICPSRQAGETYAVKHDVVEKRLVEPRIFPGERFKYNVKREPKVPRMEASIPFAKRPVSPLRQKHTEGHVTVATPASSLAGSRAPTASPIRPMANGLSQGSMVSGMSGATAVSRWDTGKVTKVKLGSRTSRYGGALVFDSSSYDKLRKPPPVNLSPAVISKRAGANMFAHMLTVKQGQMPSGGAPRVGSLISDKVKRFRTVDAGDSRDTYGN